MVYALGLLGIVNTMHDRFYSSVNYYLGHRLDFWLYGKYVVYAFP